MYVLLDFFTLQQQRGTIPSKKGRHLLLKTLIIKIVQNHL